MLTQRLIFALALSLGTYQAVNAQGAPAKTPAVKVPAKKSSPSKADLADGKKVFETYCVACHGATGQGDGVAASALNPKPRNFTDTVYMKTRTHAQLRKVISEGGSANGLSPLMAAWKGSLKETEIDHVLAYLLTFSRSK